MLAELLSAFILLTLVIDPFGNVPVVNAMLSRLSPRRRAIVIVRECAIAYGMLVLFMMFGRKLLDIMRLSESALSIAGGVILFMVAIRMVFGSPSGIFGVAQKGEPLIVPVATPLIAGPSSLATIMLMANREPDKLGLWAAAVTATMVLTTLLLLAGARLHRAMGDALMQAVERLMGLILTTIAVEMTLAGLRMFWKTL